MGREEKNRKQAAPRHGGARPAAARKPEKRGLSPLPFAACGQGRVPSARAWLGLRPAVERPHVQRMLRIGPAGRAPN
jgi:hypothetical protein